MDAEMQLLSNYITQRHREIRQEIERNQLADSLSHPTVGARLISLLGHVLINLGQHLVAKPKGPVFHNPKTYIG